MQTKIKDKHTYLSLRNLQVKMTATYSLLFHNFLYFKCSAFNTYKKFAIYILYNF